MILAGANLCLPGADGVLMPFVDWSATQRKIFNYDCNFLD